MAYPKRIYTDVDIEEVTCQDFNRIETGIETNDVRLTDLEATSVSHTNKLSELDNKDASQDVDISKRVLQTTYNAKMSELDSKNTEQDKTIATKVPLDQYAIDKANLEDSIMQRVSNEEYAIDKNTTDSKISQLQVADAALQEDINKRVLTETYTVDKAELEKSITDNVKTLNEKNTSQDTEINKRVLTETYNTDKAALEKSIAGKTTTSLNGEQTNVNFIRNNNEGVVSHIEDNQGNQYLLGGDFKEINKTLNDYKDNQDKNVLNLIDWTKIEHRKYISSAWEGDVNETYWTVRVPVEPNTQYKIWNKNSKTEVKINMINFYSAENTPRLGYDNSFISTFTTPNYCHVVTLSKKYLASGQIVTYADGIGTYGDWYDDNIGIMVCNRSTDGNIYEPYNTYLNDNVVMPKHLSRRTGRLIHIKDGIRGKAQLFISKREFSGDIKIIVTGSNLCDGKLRNGYYTNGVYTVGNNAWCNVNPIRVNPSDWLVFSKQVRVIEYDKNGNVLRQDLCTARYPYKTSSSCSYINWHSSVQGDATSIYINIGRTITDSAETYKSNITLETVRPIGSPGATVYAVDIQLFDGVNNIYVDVDNSKTVTLLYNSNTQIEDENIEKILNKLAVTNFNKHKSFGIIPCAHRGNSYYVPENTAMAFVASFMQGFEMCESDIRWTSDGVPVILHDSTIDRTSNGIGEITSMTYEQASSYDFGTWFNSKLPVNGIPKAETFIEMCYKLGMIACLDIKTSAQMTTEQLNSLWNIIKKWHMEERVIWISSNFGDFHSIGKLYRDTSYKAKICWQQWQGATSESRVSAIDSMVYFKNTYPVSEAYTSVVYTEIDDALNTACQTNGVYIMTYFIDSIESARAIASYPAIKICTTNSQDINELLCHYYVEPQKVKDAIGMIN